MTAEEYIQLKAFARVDGFLLSLLWIASFGCYIAGLSSPAMSLIAVALAVSTPFFAGRRLRLFRDDAREGIISFGRGWAFVVLVFFYAGVVFALAQYAYFAYLDQGYLVQTMNSMLSTPEAEQMIAQYDMGDTLSQAMAELNAMRPIDMSLNILTTNIMAGIVIGVPIAALLKSDVKRTNNQVQA